MPVPPRRRIVDWSTGFTGKPVFCAVTKSGASLRIRLMAVQPACALVVGSPLREKSDQPRSDIPYIRRRKRLVGVPESAVECA